VPLDIEGPVLGNDRLATFPNFQQKRFQDLPARLI
jgi:hypothetical protein